jgi:hypothetical protein
VVGDLAGLGEGAEEEGVEDLLLRTKWHNWLPTLFDFIVARKFRRSSLFVFACIQRSIDAGRLISALSGSCKAF